MEKKYQYQDIIFDDAELLYGFGYSQACEYCYHALHLQRREGIWAKEGGYGKKCGIAGCHDFAEVALEFADGALKPLAEHLIHPSPGETAKPTTCAMS